jgi:DNA-3-methyladenine glycosylase II
MKPCDFSDPAIIAHLSRRDPVLRKVIRAHGPCSLVAERGVDPFAALVRAVAHQQLNGTAAKTILGRFTALFPGRKFPRPGDLAAVSDEQLRAVGFSYAKIASIRDLAARSLDGTIPTSRAIARMADDLIVERLVQVRGVGRWTVEMLLMFRLGRGDVLPADDFGVRNGFRIAYGLDEMPKPKALLAHGERWRPWRSVAAWYLWRAVDLEKAARTKTKAV